MFFPGLNSHCSVLAAWLINGRVIALHFFAFKTVPPGSLLPSKQMSSAESEIPTVQPLLLQHVGEKPLKCTGRMPRQATLLEPSEE